MRSASSYENKVTNLISFEFYIFKLIAGELKSLSRQKGDLQSSHTNRVNIMNPKYFIHNTAIWQIPFHPKMTAATDSTKINRPEHNIRMY